MTIITTPLFGDVVLLPIPCHVPVTERMKWRTDVINAWDGSEQRLQVRNSARRRFDYDIPLNENLNQRGFNTLYGSRDSLWAVPLWSEAQRISDLTGGLSAIPAITDNYDFRDDSLVLLWSSVDDWQLKEIQTVGSGVLNIYGTTSPITDVWAIPVRLGHLSSDSARTGNGYNSIVNVGYDLDDNNTLTVVTPAQFLGDDIYFDEWLYTGNVANDRLIQKVNKVDEALGKVSYNSPWINGRVSRDMRKILEGPAETFAFREFLHRRAGKYRAFWQPSFDSDLRLSLTGAITTILRVHNDEYSVHAANRTHIAILDSSGNWYARTILSTTPQSGDLLDLTLDTAINIDDSVILRVCWLGLKRLESDNVDLKWLGGGVAQVQVRILELAP